MNKISLFPLILLIVTAIDSIRTLPSTAFFGTSLISFYILAAVLFLVPVGLISAEFGARFPEQGGVFHWVRNAFGEKIGFFAIWLQWINTMVWYPTMLIFISGTTAYFLQIQLAESKLFLLLMSLGFFWGLTLLNLKGIQASTRINAICGTIGTLIPIIGLTFLAFWWAFSNHTMNITFSLPGLIPKTGWIESSGVIVTIMTSFLGMELSGVHIMDIERPERNFPRAIAFATGILLLTLIMGSLSVAMVIPKEDIRFVDGVMQTFSMFLSSLHLTSLIPFLAVLIVIGSTGGSLNWLVSPAKGLYQAAEFGYLPSFFLALNKHKVPSRILILQAFVVSVFCILMQLFGSVNTYYWFLMALSTGLYMLMYILLFLGAIKLGRPSHGYRIPKGIRRMSCLVGIAACTLTIIIGFLPPTGQNVKSFLGYTLLIMAGFIFMIIPAYGFILYKRNRETISFVKD